MLDLCTFVSIFFNPLQLNYKCIPYTRGEYRFELF